MECPKNPIMNNNCLGCLGPSVFCAPRANFLFKSVVFFQLQGYFWIVYPTSMHQYKKILTLHHILNYYNGKTKLINLNEHFQR